MRDIIYAILQTGDLVNDKRIYQASSLEGKPSDIVDPAEIDRFPFIVYRLGPRTPGVMDDNIPLTERQALEVWAHDEGGSYKRIEAVLAELRPLLLLAPQTPPFVRAEWVEDGPELFDDGFGSITRWSRYQLIRGRVIS